MLGSSQNPNCHENAQCNSSKKKQHENGDFLASILLQKVHVCRNNRDQGKFHEDSWKNAKMKFFENERFLVFLGCKLKVSFSRKSC